jgi:NAD(P)-dependent dehydrogenase (short-subunit alcohol dehydrogenase family)
VADRTLAGKVALVTGASRGIGAAIAERLASAGATVAIAARSLEQHPHLPGTLRETAAAIERAGGRAVAIACDLADADARARLVESVRAELGPIDLLVNNAAAAFYMPFESVTPSRFRVAFEVNVRAPWDLAQRVVPDMKARGGGVIVNLSSATAAHPHGPPYDEFHRSGGAVLYGASKAALDRVSTGLAGEYFEHRVFVNSLSPVAAVLTPGVLALGVVPDAWRESAEPVEWLAEATLALCEPRYPPITGRVLFSKPLLDELRREVRTLDGSRLHAAHGARPAAGFAT